MVIDSIWGFVIHVGEELVPNGRMSFLGKFILTPSHHRVHHSRNLDYIDKNFCNLLPIWDRLFGTYQSETIGQPPIYGVTRDVNMVSLPDVYVGDFVSLVRDIKNADRLRDKFAYLVMPPGWYPALPQAKNSPLNNAGTSQEVLDEKENTR